MNKKQILIFILLTISLVVLSQHKPIVYVRAIYANKQQQKKINNGIIYTQKAFSDFVDIRVDFLKQQEKYITIRVVESESIKYELTQEQIEHGVVIAGLSLGSFVTVAMYCSNFNIILAHEIGHSMGLKHVKDNTLMNICPRNYKLSMESMRYLIFELN